MTYEIMLAYEREPNDYDDALARAVADELHLGFPHTTNWACFGVDALDFVRTLEWTVVSLSEEPIAMCVRFRDRVNDVRGFAVYRRDARPGSLPLFAWQDRGWVETWICPFARHEHERDQSRNSTAIADLNVVSPAARSRR